MPKHHRVLILTEYSKHNFHRLATLNLIQEYLIHWPAIHCITCEAETILDVVKSYLRCPCIHFVHYIIKVSVNWWYLWGDLAHSIVEWRCKAGKIEDKQYPDHNILCMIYLLKENKLTADVSCLFFFAMCCFKDILVSNSYFLT